MSNKNSVNCGGISESGGQVSIFYKKISSINSRLCGFIELINWYYWALLKKGSDPNFFLN